MSFLEETKILDVLKTNYSLDIVKDWETFYSRLLQRRRNYWHKGLEEWLRESPQTDKAGFLLYPGPRRWPSQEAAQGGAHLKYGEDKSLMTYEKTEGQRSSLVRVMQWLSHLGICLSAHLCLVTWLSWWAPYHPSTKALIWLHVYNLVSYSSYKYDKWWAKLFLLF